MKTLKIAIILFTFFCMMTTNQLVFAYGGGMKTEEMPKDEQNSLIENACINVFETKSEEKPIICFDVNEDGLIALGSENQNRKRICVYSEDMTFLYRINFNCNGAFGFEWNGDDIEIYFVRDRADVIVDRNGNIKVVRSYIESIENEKYFNYVLGATERTVNGAKYTLKTSSGKTSSGRFGSFPYLCVTMQNGEEKILYDVSDIYTKEKHIDIITTLIFAAVPMVIIGFTWKKTYMQKKHYEENS